MKPAPALAAPAAAHVKVTGDATQGGWGVLNFRVPTESDIASTTGLLVVLPRRPADHLCQHAAEGRLTTITKKKLPALQKDDDGAEVTEYVSSVEWKATAPDAPIPPHQFNVSTSRRPAAQGQHPDAARGPDLQRRQDGQLEREGQPGPARARAPGAGPAPQARRRRGTTTGLRPRLRLLRRRRGRAWTALAVSVVALLVAIASLAAFPTKDESRLEN